MRIQELEDELKTVNRRYASNIKVRLSVYLPMLTACLYCYSTFGVRVCVCLCDCDIELDLDHVQCTHCSRKKRPLCFLVITSANINRFSNFFDRQIPKKTD